MKSKVDLKELIELFVIFTTKELNSEKEMPKLKFLFNEDARTIFETVMKHPFKEDGYWTPNIDLEDIKRIMSEPSYDCPVIEVHDPFKFFNYLKRITDKQLILYQKFGEQRLRREHCGYIMKRIWLRMGPEDFNNVEMFLKTQLEFIKDETFDYYRFYQPPLDWYGYKVMAHLAVNPSFAETTRRMQFQVYDEDKNSYYNLPSVLYDISNDEAYIYAIQKEGKRDRNSKIERTIYKLNKGVVSPTIHPSKVLSMQLFVDLLRSKNIKRIKVPTLQVLSNQYHEILSETVKINFYDKWTQTKINRAKKYNVLKTEYECDKNFYSHVVDKSDLISKIKTEDLIEATYRVLALNNDLELVSDLSVSNELDIKVKNKVKKHKK